jgi:hypothetical protein
MAEMKPAMPDQASTDAPEVQGVIEVLNRSGQVLQRIVYSGGNLTVGRAFDNDIIVGDPYVCPHHLEIEQQEGGMRVRDLESINGSYIGGQSRRFIEDCLPVGESLHFGHSQLRYQPAGMAVADTWQDTARHGLMSHFGSQRLLVLSVTAACLVLMTDTLLETIEEVSLGLLANELFYPLMGLLLWSGFWSLINRVIAHRANLTTHLSIASSGMVALFILGHLIELLGFAFGLDDIVPVVLTLERMTVLSLVLYAHLRIATHSRFGTGALIAGFTSLLLVGTPAATDMLSKPQFNSIPELDPLLKPPAYQWRNGVSTEKFFQDAESLQEKVDEAARELQSE